MRQITAPNSINRVMLDDFVLLCVYFPLFNEVGSTNDTCITSAYFEERESGNVGRFSPAVRCWAGKQKGLGSILLWLSFHFEKVVVCGHCLATLSLTIRGTLKWLSSLPVLTQESF